MVTRKKKEAQPATQTQVVLNVDDRALLKYVKDGVNIDVSLMREARFDRVRPLLDLSGTYVRLKE